MSEIIESPAITSISNPSDRKRLRGNLQEIVELMDKAEQLKIAKKIIVDEIKRQYGIAPGHTNGLAKAMYKDNYSEVRASQEDFETLYEAIIASPQSQREIADAKPQFTGADVDRVVAAYTGEDEPDE